MKNGGKNKSVAFIILVSVLYENNIDFTFQVHTNKRLHYTAIHEKIYISCYIRTHPTSAHGRHQAVSSRHLLSIKEIR